MIYLRKIQSEEITGWRRVVTLVGWLLMTTIGYGVNPDVAASAMTASGASAIAVQTDVDRQSIAPWPQEQSDLMPDPAIQFERLPNGFRYLLLENRHPEDRVSLHLVIDAGSLNETDDQQGVAHFLEHMLFNGSTNFPPGQLVRYFQSIGMQFGNDANAHTGFDETVYDLVLPSGDTQSLTQGLLVMHDYAMGALLLEEEVKRESGVILAEMRSRDSAGYRTFKQTLGFELPDHLVSKRLPIGKADVIRHADRDLLKSFYDGWYRPELMTLVMVGDFSASTAERLVEERFSTFSARAPLPELPETGTVDHDGLEVFYHHEPGQGGTTVGIEVVRLYDRAPDSLAHRRRQMVRELADRIVQNRLDSRLKSPDAPYTSAAVGSGVYLNRIRYAEISADSGAQNWRQTLAAIEQELRRALLYGFTESELTRVKKERLKSLDNAAREAPTRDSTTLARQFIRDLGSQRVIQSPEQEQLTLAPMIDAASLVEVHRAFRENWPESHRLVMLTGDAELPHSSSKTPEWLIRDTFLASAGTVVHPPLPETTSTFPYLPEPDALGAIVFREVVEDLGITRLQFENGVWLNLKRTDFKTNEVKANLIFGRGQSSEPVALPGLSLLAEATVDESGLGAMDTDELERALAGRSTSVDFEIAETHFSLSAKSVSEEAELLFQLIHAHLMDPGFREEALALARERLSQDYQSYKRSVEGMMRIEGLRLLAGGDSRFGIPPLERLQAVRLDHVREWIAPQLTAAPLEMSIVGDFDEDEVIGLARRYLGSLPKRGRPADARRGDLPFLPTGRTYRIEVDSRIAKALVVAAWQTEDFWDIKRTRRLSVLADIFSERLRERIREKLGASYSPYAFNRASRAYPGYGVFQAYVNVAPDQDQIVLNEVKAIARNLAGNGVAPDELARAIDPILTSIKEMRQTNGYWLNSVMTGSQGHPQQLEWARSFTGDYAAITAEELGALAALYLTETRSASIIIQPEGDDG